MLFFIYNVDNAGCRYTLNRMQETMSKLGLGRAKLASTVSSAFGPEPPDKKRKTEDNAAMESAFDDDLDILLTQNMNKLDRLVASTQSAAHSGYDEHVSDNGDRLHHTSASTAESVGKCEAGKICPITGEQTAVSNSKRLIGHGSSHSRSADCLNSASADSSVQMTRKGSFSVDNSCTRNKESNTFSFSTSFQQHKRATDSSMRSSGIIHAADAKMTAAFPMRLDANANCTEKKLEQISEECEYYKVEVCIV